MKRCCVPSVVPFNTGFPATVFEVVSTGLFGKMGLFKWMGRRERESVYQAIERVGLGEVARRKIGDLSGGQQQRAFIARALVANPALLFLDEPTVGVDAESERQFFELLEGLRMDLGITILLVSHDRGSNPAACPLEQDKERRDGRGFHPI